MNIEQLASELGLTNEEVKTRVFEIYIKELEYFKEKQRITKALNSIITALLEFEKETGMSLGYKTYLPITTQTTNPLIKLKNVYKELQEPKPVKPVKQLDEEGNMPWDI